MKTVNPCKYAKKCGACQLQNMTYEEQLSFKMKKTIYKLRKFQKIDNIIPSDSIFRYRNKSNTVFYQLGNIKNAYGIYKSTSESIIPVKDCLLENEKISSIISNMKKIFDKHGIYSYDKIRNRGNIRSVLIRTSESSGEILVAIVTKNKELCGLKSITEELTSLNPEITTVVQCFNQTKTTLWMDAGQNILYGPGYITDSICDSKFKISAHSFYQINSKQAEKLYNLVMESIKLCNTEKISVKKSNESLKIIDAYCGVGTMSIIAAKIGASVTGVEINPKAISDAISNKELNNVKNVKFICRDAGEYMKKCALNKENTDIVIMDPPRSGANRNFIDALLTLSPDNIIYVSCSVDTLARDLNILSREYTVKKITPVDMFPNTEHVETVALLSHKKSDKPDNVLR